MAGEDSESGYQDETSEMASSGSELESDFESGRGSQDMVVHSHESEERSVSGQSAGERSAANSEYGEDPGYKTVHGPDTTGGGQESDRSSVASSRRPHSRLPRLRQPPT